MSLHNPYSTIHLVKVDYNAKLLNFGFNRKIQALNASSLQCSK